ncbi:MAG: flagellar motor stator protein MotA [Candidatus Magnetominusculus sp. LBB02]|nr:flagellar motor stator protein MotA [Candidatus Magnetominusculus sp. LBB02]
MTVIIGMVMVIGAILGGYLIEHGNVALLLNPPELLIIFGAAIGSLVVATPMKVIKGLISGLKSIMKEAGYTKQQYLEMLSLLFIVFSKVRKEGLISIEQDVEDPEKSPMFSKYQSVIHNHHALRFICDNLKVIITTNMPPHELADLLDIDIEVNAHEEAMPAQALQKMGDALPGFGIVAAVLGVVLTMEKIAEPPTVLGHCIGSALVGTFLGILLCYGFVGPMASNLETKAKEGEIMFYVIKTALVAFVGGAAPQIAVESGRRAIPGGDRPTFSELEQAVRK